MVKKNGTVLKNLITWLGASGELQSNGNRLIKGMPLLLIDDEADNASVNVSKDAISTVRYQVESVYKASTNLTQRPTATGLQVGLRYAF